jgi:glycosyltransferase involved in cell wall biosynthesis
MKARIDKVVVISDDLEAGGGAASIALASIRQLRARNIPVTALLGGGTRPDIPGCEDPTMLGGRNLLDDRRARAAMRGLYDERIRAQMSDWIAENDTPGTLYHLHTWHQALSPSCFAALRRVADRLLLSTHDFFLVCPNGGYFDFRRRTVCDLTPLSTLCLATNCDKRNFGHKLWRVARHLMRERLIDFADSPATVLAVHQGMKPLLERGGVPGAAIQVLRNPVTPWLTRRVEAERNRSILYVGRLDLGKGVDTLAIAAHRIGARLTIIGDGPLRDRLHELCPGADLLGRLESEAIGAIAKSARVLVVPSRVRETFSLVALEAAKSGLPVVLSASALISDELVASGAAVGCPPDSPDILAERLAHLMHDDPAVETMSRRAFAAAADLAPSEAEWGSQLVDIYQDTLARSASAPRPAPSPPAARATRASRPA